ncbi:amidohydrolase family protein [Cryobacterium tepidiphilum]|uniref:amidohydrolase family protein n=1 Tax=Cryobacterium tepidiphilum TaxID=2486026 RepID=UPI0013141282|nr:amidohydrolase family protein [Cryobacterium tepidiphilum]
MEIPRGEAVRDVEHGRRLVVRGGMHLDDAGRLTETDIVIHGNVIADIGPGCADRYPHAQAIDARGCLILPGLVNAHTHSYSQLCRHDGAGLPLEPWMMYAWAATAGRTREEVKLTAQLQAIEALRTGTTSLLDHLGGAVQHQEAALEAYEEIGIRARVAPMISDVPLPQTIGVADEDWPAAARHRDPVFAQPAGDDLIDATLDLHRSWHSPSGRTGVMFGPSSPQRCTPAMMARIAAISRESGIRVHTHLQETRVQASLPAPRGASGWLEVMDQHGLLTPLLSTAHNVWLTRSDLDVLAERGVTLVHNPQSNLQLGSGIAELAAWRGAGVDVALGTDGANCGGSLDMVNAMRFALLLHRPGRRDPARWETPASVLHLATRGGAGLLGLAAGRIAVGALADLSVFSLEQPVYASGEDPLATLILSSWDHSARTVIVDGDLVVADGRLTRIDEAQVIGQAAEARRELLARNAPLADYARAQEQFLIEVAARAESPRPLMPID